jgi:putative drug exporter of the RND superfamily
MAFRSNLAGTLGAWSARHRVAAIAGWVAFVVVAMLIGSAVGQVTMKQAEYSTGESGHATRLLTDAGITEPAQELVLVHSATATAGASGFQAAVRAVVSGVEATGRVRDMRAPAVAASRHDVLVQFAMKGDPDTSADRVQPVLDAVARARAAHPDVTIEQFGEASANKWFNDTIMKDFKRAEWTACRWRWASCSPCSARWSPRCCRWCSR